MRLLKKGMAIALAAAMVVTLAPANADAAKKVKLSAKSKNVAVKKSFTLKLKNGSKKAKVSWKTSNKKVAALSKQVKKGNKASVKVTGKKKGSAKITATYKLGKKKTKLTCKVTVGQVAPTAAPTLAATTAPTAAPTGLTTVAPTATAVPGTATPVPTPKPTRTPKPSPTPSPTPMPVPTFAFEEVTNGIPIDVSTYVSIGGNGGYNAETGRVEINDQSATDVSQGAWALPETIPAIQLGDLVTFRVQGFNYGTSGFRFWIGTGTSGACTPILLNNTIDETLKVGEFPCVVTDEEGNSKTMNQMQLVPDEDTKAFDVTFTFKAGESQNDTDGVFSDLTLKYIMGGDTSGYIDGLCIKNIYYITDDASLLPTPTPGEDDSTAVTPSALKVDAPFTVDGVAEEGWNDIKAVPFASRVTCDNKGDSTTTATAKLAWDAQNLYGLVTVLDEDIDATATNDYQRDGVEFFLDEDNDAVTDWANNADAFQYRFTGLTKDTEGAKLAALTKGFAGGSDAARTAYAGIESEYTFIEGGYVVEFKIPFVAEKAAGDVVGFDAIVQDCKDGKRDAEIYFGATEVTKSYWNLADTFNALELVEPEPVEPGTIEDLGALDIKVNGTAEKTVNDDGTLTFTNADGFAAIFIPLGKDLVADEKVNVKVEYEAAGTSSSARLYLTNGTVDSALSNIVPATPKTVEGEMTASSAANTVQVKVASHGQSFTSLTIKKVVITYPEAE